eukprot:scaffold177_cov334-Pavlova_lutheri.AAC.35
MEAWEAHWKQLRLRTVVKESHGRPVAQMAYAKGSCSNLVAVVGGDQANIYDDRHFGRHLDVVAQYVHVKTKHVPGGELKCCCFVVCTKKESGKHPYGDVRLAVGGEDGSVSILSLVEGKVLHILKKHRKPVVAVAADASVPGEIVSLANDGMLCHWDAEHGTLLHTVEGKNATSVAIEPATGKGILALVTGHKTGQIKRWILHNSKDFPQRKRARLMDDLPLHGHSKMVDCLAFLSGNRMASKSTDGKVIIWNYELMEQVCAWQVRVAGSEVNLGHFGPTGDGSYIATGAGDGHVHIHCTFTGKNLTTLSPVKVSGPVTCCIISADYNHVLASLGAGFIFRFEHRESGEGCNLVADTKTMTKEVTVD